MIEETGWLIAHPTEVKWWTGDPGFVNDPDFWTTDASKALRFARREDAENQAHAVFDSECRIEDHMWCDYKHDWFKHPAFNFESCRDCGVVRRADDKNGPCKGPVKVALRDRHFVVPVDPTPAMIEAGAQRLASFEDGSVWPDSWDAGQVAQMRIEAERVWRSMVVAASSEMAPAELKG